MSRQTRAANQVQRSRMTTCDTPYASKVLSAGRSMNSIEFSHRMHQLFRF